MSLDPTYPLMPVLNFVGGICALVPFPWMLQSWNVGAAALSIWVSLKCLNSFINMVVWRDNWELQVPVFCDICAPIPYFPAS